MRQVPSIPVVVVQLLLSASCASTRMSPSWPAQGSVVFVSRELHPDFSQSTGSQGTADFLTGKDERNPVVGGDSNLPAQRLPACQPVEVRAVHGTSIRVRWVEDGRNSSTLGEGWSSFVHRSKDECLERMKTPKEVMK